MIRNFEEFTYELTDEERKASALIVRGLSIHRGKESAITNGEIREKIKKHGFEITGPRIRKIINYIRVKGLVPTLCASSRGYYVAIDENEHIEYLYSLQQRINSMNLVFNAGTRDYLTKWKKELNFNLFEMMLFKKVRKEKFKK